MIEMEPSKMMTSKEKEWIFKISMMSLLSGDFMASDYYFIVSIPKFNMSLFEYYLYDLIAVTTMLLNNCF